MKLQTNKFTTLSSMRCFPSSTELHIEYTLLHHVTLTESYCRVPSLSLSNFLQIATVISSIIISLSIYAFVSILCHERILECRRYFSRHSSYQYLLQGFLSRRISQSSRDLIICILTYPSLLQFQDMSRHKSQRTSLKRFSGISCRIKKTHFAKEIVESTSWYRRRVHLSSLTSKTTYHHCPVDNIMIQLLTKYVIMSSVLLQKEIKEITCSIAFAFHPVNRVFLGLERILRVDSSVLLVLRLSSLSVSRLTGKKSWQSDTEKRTDVISSAS